MTYKDYERTVSGRLASIGILHGEYVWERRIQSGMASEFRKISKKIYNSYDAWCEDEQQLMELRCLDIWCIGFSYTSEFQCYE